MKISIITVCYNSRTTIRDTIESVLAQNYSNIEYIIVDGLSNDGTLDIIREYGKRIDIVISESDIGIYDAMNKGIQSATGDVIGILNSDDFYIDDHVLSDVAKVFLDQNIDACYGDLVYVKQNNVDQVVRFWKSRDYKLGLFKAGWMPPHPTFFVRKSVYERLGSFDLNYKIAADFELLFRFIEQHKIRTRYLPKVLVKMRLGGKSNKSLANIYKQNREIIRALKCNYRRFSISKFLLNKAIIRFIQLLTKLKLAK